MFEKCDLSKKIDDKTFEKEIKPLQVEIGVLTRALWEHRVPIIIVVEGWNASGITMVISELIQHIDPRGFSLHSVGSPNDEERARPLLWRFFTRIPAKGRIAIFARSWYSRSLAEEVSGIDWKSAVRFSIDTINSFERQLSDDGAVIIKFFLHISKEEQKRRLDEREGNLLTSWMITKGDWDFHHHYDSYLPVIELFVEGTDKSYAPWTVVEATDSNYTCLKVYSTIIKRLRKHLDRIESSGKPEGKNNGKNGIIKPPKTTVKRQSAPQVEYSRPEYEKHLVRCQEKVRDIQYLLYKRKIPLIIVYEGWDAAGKGGNIMRLVRLMNPRGYDVVSIARPDQTELDHHYLWRFYQRFPKAGHITIFDRSWYGRLLVERVEGYCTPSEWRRAYREINEMEQAYVGSGGGLIKFWLEVSKDEQLKRFQDRQNDPLKEWKITDEDWRNRAKWDEYEEAVDEMLSRTSTAEAPWTIVESDDKYYARLKTLQTVIDYGRQLLR
ncbi:MAG TPA: polyphosphate:AMP phosphotransferase [Methanoregulaceae archaeon]|nr:polyphosphate:AMP phosphotransferase [Methanoregulaceae archaeon]HQA80547.1 polyphosphate:AMP phosphotransferase [Methanoregulaceae archaeon]